MQTSILRHPWASGTCRRALRADDALMLNADDEGIVAYAAELDNTSVWFSLDPDNPGRGNCFEHEGIRILVDIAHNEHGMPALADTIRQMAAERVVLLMGQAGDRPDCAIQAQMVPNNG